MSDINNIPTGSILTLKRNIYTGKEHKLIYSGTGNGWYFEPAEEWMPIYLTYDLEDNHKIIALDSEGFGSPVYVGDKVCEGKFEVEAIVEVDDKFMLILK